MNQKTLSLKLTNEEIKSLKSALLKNGWKEESMYNEYVNLRMKSNSGSVCTVYTSMKVVFQGNEDFSNLLDIVMKSDVGFEVFKPHIGVDEVGKGDYFGPLVVVGCFVNDEFKKKLLKIGVGDSKKFSDKKILEMYDQIKGYEMYYVSVVKPEEYNALNAQFKNVSLVLAKQHAKVIEMGLSDLKARGMECKQVVIDQFSSRNSRVTDELGPLGKGIEFVQFHKGESDIAVACASVIARGIFLEEMGKMNDEYYFKFPKGATHVIEPAKEFVKKHGAKELEKVAKISFKTTKQVLQNSF